MPLRVPPDQRRRLECRFGPAVGPWLDGLAAQVERATERWGLRPEGTVWGGNTAIVVPCDDAVLKLTPDPALGRDEAAALTHWAGRAHVVGLRDHDVDGTLLLDRLRPGEPLGPGTSAADALPALLDLWSVDGVPDGLPPLVERVRFALDLGEQRAASAPGPLAVDDALRRRGRDAALALAREPGHHGLVHGDLHGGNLLRATVRDGAVGPVVVDPRPCVGDRTFDLVDPLLVDPVPVDARELVARVATLRRALPGFDADRAISWLRALAPAEALAAGTQDPGSERSRRLARLAAG